MSSKVVVISWSVVLFLGACCWVFYRDKVAAETRLSWEELERARLLTRLLDLQREVDTLRDPLAKTRQREAALQVVSETLIAAARDAAVRAESALTAAAADDARTEPAVLTSVEDADELAAECFRRGDMKGIFKLRPSFSRSGRKGTRRRMSLPACWTKMARRNDCGNSGDSISRAVRFFAILPTATRNFFASVSFSTPSPPQKCRSSSVSSIRS